MRRAVLAALIALALPVAAAESVLWKVLSPGPYAIGYVHVGSAAAPLDLWFPAQAAALPMTFGDYVARPDEMRGSLRQMGVSDDAAAAFLAAPMVATRDAVPVLKPRPLVLIAQGNAQDAADQAVLAEYIASHGFVVASVPSPMIRRRMTDQSQLAAFAEEQADALGVAAAEAARLLPLTGSIAVVGHSFGARAALLLAMRNAAITKVVSLDGGIGTINGTAEMHAAKSFRTRMPRLAILHFYEEMDERMKPDFTLLRSLRLERLLLDRTTAMSHVHFTTYGFAAAGMPELAQATKADPQVATDVRLVAERTLRFLETGR